MLDQGPTSLFLFTPSSPLRRLATWVCMSKAFETVITCTIILNCVTMMLDAKLGSGDRAILSGQLVRKTVWLRANSASFGQSARGKAIFLFYSLSLPSLLLPVGG